MARIQIDLPQKFLFKTEIKVRASDVNYGGHVGNDSILTLMQEARLTFYRSMGFKDEISLDGSIGQIITEATIQYKAESFIGDLLEIYIGVETMSKYGFDMIYQVKLKSDGKEVARARTGIVCFDYSNRKIATVPGILLNKLSKHTERNAL